MLLLPSCAHPLPPPYPADEHFRVVYDAKGRFVVHRITKEEASYKLCKVRRLAFGKGGIPHIGTHDGRTIRYPDPEIKVGVWALHCCVCWLLHW